MTMKKLKFIKEYLQFRENFDSETEDSNIIDSQEEHEETEEVEVSCQDKLEEAINNLDSAIQSCIGVEETEEDEELQEDVQQEEETEGESHEECEMEIYNRMKELSEELKQLMSELKGEESQEETESEEDL